MGRVSRVRVPLILDNVFKETDIQVAVRNDE